MDQYRTVKNEAEDEFVERRSRFIGRVKPVKTEEDAVSFYTGVQIQILGCFSQCLRLFSERRQCSAVFGRRGAAGHRRGAGAGVLRKKRRSPIWW